MKYLLSLLVLFPLVCSAERIVCPVTADTWTAMHRWEGPAPERADAEKNHGQDQQLVIQGRTAFALLNFDVSALKGMTISKAVMRVHRVPAAVPLHTVGLSTISGNGAWLENAVNFFQRAGKQAWSYPGSDLVDVTFAQGGSLYSYERVRDAGNGWWEFDVPPALIAALVTGDQFGLMLCDEKGQTQVRHALSSRETANPPVLIVEAERSDETVPGAVRSLKSGGGVLESSPAETRLLGRTTLRLGSVVLHFGTAGDDAGAGVATRYDVRYSPKPVDASNFDAATPAPRWSFDPLAPKPDAFATANSLRDEVHGVVEDLTPGEIYHFAARAIDEAGNAGPVSALGRYRAYTRSFPSLPPAGATPTVTGSLGESAGLRVWAFPETMKIDPKTGDLLEKSDFAEPRSRNTVWDAASRTVKLTGARNEFVAFQVAIESAQPLSAIDVRLSKPLFAGVKLPPVFQQTGAVQMYREWFVPDDRRKGPDGPWYPDALIPVKGALAIPAADNAVPGQTAQPLFVDVFIPHEAKPGVHKGELMVRAAGKEFPIRMEIDVLPLRLPDTLGFVVDLNCYSSVRSGKPGTPEYRKLEQAYHRIAHLHRTNLDVLGYSHVGTTVPDHAPPLEGEGAATKVKSWEDWDAHFGSVLDGSAFADLPRAKVPVPAMYLPFFENWPGDLRKSYRFDDPTVPKTQDEYMKLIIKHALTAEAIEKSFSQEYQDRYSAVVSEFAQHFRQKGWLKTKYLVYFNNKYYWKRPEQGGHGIGWWLFDEPNHRDDVLATNFLAYLTHKGMRQHPDVPILLRTDISRTEWMRDLLAGQVDLNCISRRFIQKNRLLQEDRNRYGREYWNYASSNHPRATNVSMRAWCWRVWLNAGDGLLPWNAVSGARAWDQAEELTLFYPGEKFGQLEPFASMRLKAYRRGQQDMEYLILLAQKRGWDRDAVTHAIAGALDLSSDTKMTWEEDAGTVTFDKVKDADMESLRLRVARALTGK